MGNRTKDRDAKTGARGNRTGIQMKQGPKPRESRGERNSEKSASGEKGGGEKSTRESAEKKEERYYGNKYLRHST